MAKTIKTKESIGKIAVHDISVNSAERAKQTATKAKKSVSENTSQITADNPEEYAADKVTETAQTVAEDAAAAVDKTIYAGVKLVHKKVKNKKQQKKTSADNPPDDTGSDTPESEPDTDTAKPDSKATEQTPSEPSAPDTEKPPEKSNRKADTSDKKTKDNSGTKAEKGKNDNTGEVEKEKSRPADKNQSGKKAENSASPPQQKTETSANKSSNRVNERQKSSPKQRTAREQKTIRQTQSSIRQTQETNIKMKPVSKGKESAKTAVKTADRTAKTAQRTAKTAKNSAETAAKAAKKAEEAARATAKAMAKAAKVAAKAVVEAVKAIVAGVKTLAALIASGGTVAVVVVVIICLIAVIGGSCLGIFLSNDNSSGSQMTMTSAMQTITSSFFADMTALKTSFTYDSMEVYSPTGDTSISWKDAIAVYAVKSTTSADNAYEVVTVDDTKLQLLIGIVKDMNKMTGAVVVKVVPVTTVTTDENGNTTASTSYESKRVLIITITHLTAEQAAEQYNFNAQQKQQLTELMSSEYDAQWAELLNGSGEVLITNSTWRPVGIFSWPFEVDNVISSPFGTRRDPSTGVWKTHGGTDIAIAQGTPILAAASGTVEIATWENSYGYYVRIRHNETYETLYAHCSALLVSAVQTVHQGQVIALVGSTGYSTGPHTHFEVIENGIRVDAMGFFTN